MSYIREEIEKFFTLNCKKDRRLRRGNIWRKSVFARIAQPTLIVETMQFFLHFSRMVFDVAQEGLIVNIHI